MTNWLVVCFFLIALNGVKAQGFVKEKTEITGVIGQFRESIVKKDSVRFLRLFTPEAFVWAGAFRNRSQLKKENPGLKNYFLVDYRTFHRFLGDKGKQEEGFDNIRITNDDVIASVTFDYQYWNDGELTNWGKEFWSLIKMNGEWKIVSVIFSIDE